jgi:death-on-curing protein
LAGAREVILPTLDQLIRLNRRQIDVYGGLFLGDDNLLNRATLESALVLLEFGAFGDDHYPTLAEKAAYLMHRIVSGHVFRDGNKRTGLGAALIIVRLNGGEFPLAEPADQDAIDFTLSLADGKKSYEDVLAWVKLRMK